MRILLVSPAIEMGCRYHFPMGVAMVSSALKAAGHHVHCLNLDLEDDWREAFTRAFGQARPMVVASGGMTPAFGFLERLFALAKDMAPKVTTVLGGGVIGSEPLALGALQADIGVIGEGEVTAVELMDRLRDGRELLDVPGLLLKNRDGSLHRTAARQYVTDLDSLPMADYHGFNFGECLRRYPFQAITTSRGCPFHCTFCYCVLGRGKYRFNSIGRVIEELKHLQKEFGLTNIGLIDEIFALKKERVLEFCEAVKPLGLAWSTQIRVELAGPELLDAMREAGCYQLFYGLESMCPEILRSMNKRLKPAQVERALELTYQSGVRVFGNFIFGDPAETAETAWTTLEWWLANRKHGINLGKIDCWPGTAIHKQAVSSGVIPDPVEFIRRGCPMTNLTAMPDSEWMAVMRRVWACHEAMLFPCKLLSADLGSNGGSAECVCPHCGKTVRLKGLMSLPPHHDRGTQRVACPECPFDFDIPLRIAPKPADPKDTALIEAALEARGASGGPAAPSLEDPSGDRAGWKACLRRLEPFRPRGWGQPVAAFLAALCHLMLGEAEDACEIARLSLRHNPASPSLLEMYAACLRRAGDARFSAAFFRQALLVRDARLMAVTPETMAVLDPLEALLVRLFPAGAVNLDSAVFWERWPSGTSLASSAPSKGRPA